MAKEAAVSAVPEGYRKNAKGDLIQVSTIRDSDIAIDEFVNEAAGVWLGLQGLIRDFKIKMFGDTSALLDMIAEKYDVKRGGKKGSVTLYSYDGRFKLLVAVQDSLDCGPEVQVALQLISECLMRWTEVSGVELKTIVQVAVAPDAAGNLSVGKLLGLRRYKIADPQWNQAMAAIGDALLVVGSKQYIRLYERNEVGAYISIALDIAAL
jgi:hypothetical protein